MKKYVKKLMAMLMVMLLVVTMAAPATVSAAPVRLNKSSVTVLVGKTYQLKVKGTSLLDNKYLTGRFCYLILWKGRKENEMF